MILVTTMLGLVVIVMLSLAIVYHKETNCTIASRAGVTHVNGQRACESR